MSPGWSLEETEPWAWPKPGDVLSCPRIVDQNQTTKAVSSLIAPNQRQTKKTEHCVAAGVAFLRVPPISFRMNAEITSLYESRPNRLSCTL